MVPRVAAGLIGSAALIAVLTVLSRVVGFGRVFVFSGTVGGGGCLGTAYTTANQVPNVLFEVAAGGALAGTVVPVLAGHLARGRRADADRTASALLSWAVLILLPLSLLLALLARPLVDLLWQDAGGGAGQCPGAAAAGARMLVVFAPQVVLYGVGIVATGILQAHRRFAWPALAPLLSSAVVIVAYLLFGAMAAGRQRDDTWLPGGTAELVLAGGTTLGVMALSVPLLWPVRRAGTRLRPTLRFPAGTAAQVRALALAGLGALLAQQAAVVATLALASRVGGMGAINVVQFAQAVYLLPYAVLAVPLATAAFPRLSAQAAGGDRTGFAATTAATTRLVLLASCLGAGVLAAAAPALQRLFLALDAVGGTAFTSFADTLLVLAPGLVGWGLVAHLTRVLYADGRGRAAAWATATGWLVAVGASLVAVLGLAGAGTVRVRAAVVGLGLGNTAGMLAAGLLLLVAVHRAGGAAAMTRVPRTLVVGAAAAVLGALAGRWVAGPAIGAGAGGGPPRHGFGAAGLPATRGAAAAVVALAVFVAVLAVTDRHDLRAALARLRRRGHPEGGGPDGGGPEGGGPGGGGPEGGGPGGGPEGGGPGGGRSQVLLVLATSGGGVGRHVVAVAGGLVASGFAVEVAGPHQTEETFRFTGAGARFSPVAIADRVRPRTDLAALARLRGLVAGAGVVHAHGLRAGALAVLAARSRRRRHRPPVVVTLHNAPVGGRAARVHAVLLRIVARGADAVLVVSGDLGERVRGLGARGVERALVPAPRRVPTGDPATVRAALGVAEGTALLVTAARLADQKGLPVLLDAVALLAAARPPGSVLAVIAGDGPLHGELAADLVARDLPVRLLGRRDDVPALMAAADVVVVPSVWEGQPLVVQEALYAGAAVVATDAGGTREVTGDAAVLVRVGDAAALAEAVGGILDDRGALARLRDRAAARGAALPGDAEATAQLRRVYAAVGCGPAGAGRAATITRDAPDGVVDGTGPAGD